MAYDEKKYRENLKILRSERAAIKAELSELLGNN